MSYISQPREINSFYPHPLNLCSTYKLKVEGKGSIKAQPDTASVILGVTTENNQLKLAQEQNTIKINEILNTLKKFGVSSNDIETQSYNISPEYDYVEGKQIFKGYKVIHDLKVTVRDMNKIGEIIDAAVASGANTVNNISFIVSEPSKYYQQALTAAIDDALIKTITIGRKLKISVSQIPTQIAEEKYQHSTPVQPFLLQATGNASPIQIGQIDIIARIVAIFAYSPQGANF